MTPLRIAISPCPNDSFIFGAWVLGLTPSPQGLDCRFFWHDVQELNHGALTGEWDVIKVSAATALRLEDTCAILPCGGAFGLEHGPKLVTRKGFRRRIAQDRRARTRHHGGPRAARGPGWHVHPGAHDLPRHCRCRARGEVDAGCSSTKRP
jgi:predicted solute-binding protein